MRINLDDAICAAVFASSGAFNTTFEADVASTRGSGVKTHRRLRRIMTRIARRLELTDRQRAEIKSIINTERLTIGPLIRQLVQLLQEMEALHTQGPLMAIIGTRAIAAHQTLIKAELAVARERVKVKIYSVLTAEQRAKAGKMVEYLESRLHDPFSNRAA